MRNWLVVGLIAVAGLDLAGCTPGNNTMGATGVGAVAGGLIGNQIFHGKNAFAGVIAGALIGGVIGNQIGQYMDRQDKINMQSAIINTPVGQQASWTSNQAGPNNSAPVTYTVKPVKAYQNTSNQYCREYQTTIVVEGKTQQAYGKACRTPDGQWKIQNQQS